MFEKFKQWRKNNLDMFIRCNSKESSVILSKKLFESIKKDHPNDSNISVLFSKLRKQDGTKDYIMFFNPDWEKHGVNNPKMIQTSPVTLGKFGHIGFQTLQPSVMELQTMFGIENDEFDLYVNKGSINGEPYYLLYKK